MWKKEVKMKNPTPGEPIIKDYPNINDLLIECLERDFPNKLPTNYIDSFELGVLLGQQKVIEKLKAEKLYQENK